MYSTERERKKERERESQNVHPRKHRSYFDGDQ